MFFIQRILPAEIFNKLKLQIQSTERKFFCFILFLMASLTIATKILNNNYTASIELEIYGVCTLYIMHMN